MDKIKTFTADDYTKLDHDETTLINDFIQSTQLQEQQMQNSEQQQQMLPQLQQQQQVNQQVLQQLGFNLYDDNLDLSYATINDTAQNITENTNLYTLYGTTTPSLIDCNNNDDNSFTNKILSLPNDSNLYIDDDFILNYLNTPTESNQQIPPDTNNLYSLTSSDTINQNNNMVLSPYSSSSLTHSPSSLLTAANASSIDSSPSDINYLELQGTSVLSSSDATRSIIGISNDSISNSFTDYSSKESGICFKFEYTFENQKLVQVQPPPPAPIPIILPNATNNVVPLTETISTKNSSYDTVDCARVVELPSPLMPTSLRNNSFPNVVNT
ncbi:hypothetical protein EVAR_73979_1 [Eumeta japonica]|uniref:Uncharacterized protein n=1 Tax=Eumeta variegata TaxID=151549 RepID=A0A4C1SWN7_EUMVA|nr:hypothetical protein EVAR_73979_1 [Eumeta japonica]